MTKIGLDSIASPELERNLYAGDLDVLIPLGALEQHGPHLPLGTDSLIARAMAEAVADRVEALVVAPCLPVGCSDPHLSFCGTASISAATLDGYLQGVITTLLGHGFRCAYVISGHAGNMATIEAAIQTLPADLKARALALTDWSSVRKALHAWAGSALGFDPETVGSHAGHFETSIMLFLHPELVHMEDALPGYVGPLDDAMQRMRTHGIGAISEVGVLGDPCSATAKAGKGYLEVLVSTVEMFIEDHRGRASTADRAELQGHPRSREAT